MRFDKKSPSKSDKKSPPKAHKKGVVGYNKKTALLEEAITHMNAGKYGRSSAVLKELLALDPLNTEARRLFATLHLRLGSLISARTAFESLAREALERQDFWLAESLLREYLTAGPRCVPFLDMLGQVYEQKGDAMAAVAEYGKAVDVVIEDPDPEYPHRAAELFAKIRSLAPGSPVALRLASWFDSSTGELLTRSTASSHNPSIEEEQAVTAPPSEGPGDPAGFSAIPPERPEDSTEQTAQAEAPIPSSVPQEQGVSATAEVPDPVSGEAVSPLEEEVCSDDADLPLKLVDETAPVTTQPIAADVAQPLSADLDATGLSLQEETVSPEIDHSIAVPDLSLHEVTHPIAEAPSAPLPMPWDQVQDTTLSIPHPSEEGTQTLLAHDSNEIDSAPIAEPAGMADDQPLLPVPSEALLSSMSWEEILAAVGKGLELPPEPKPADPTAAHEPANLNLTKTGQEPIQTPTLSDQAPADLRDPVLRPISEPVAKPQPLPSPMPWEQVEEEPVPILQHEPEPEFGVVPEDTSTPFVDDTVPPHSSHAGVEPSDDTVAIREATAAPVDEAEKAPAEPEHAPVVSSPLQIQEESREPSHQESSPLLCISEETVIVSGIPVEPPAIEQAAMPGADHESSLPTMTDGTAIVAEDASTATPAEPDTLPACEPSNGHMSDQDDPMCSSTEPIHIDPVLESVQADNPVAGSDSLVGVPEPPPDAAMPAAVEEDQDHPTVAAEPLPAASFSPEQPPALLEPVSSAGREPEVETSSMAADNSTPGEIKILCGEQAQQLEPEQAGSGLLARWLRRPKPDHSAASRSSDAPGPDPSTGFSTPADPSLPEPTTSVMPAIDGLCGHSGSSPSIRSGETPAKRQTGKPLVVGLYRRLRRGAVLLIGTCFSTTRSVTISLLSLASAIIAVGVVGLGVAGLGWVLMEEHPNTAFHNLSATPQRALEEASTNGYLVLLGFDRANNRDPVQAGFERTFEKSDLAMNRTCLTSRRERESGEQAAAEPMLDVWHKDPDPAARFHAQAESVRASAGQAGQSMARYKEWLKMPFEDWGYGVPMSPNCSLVLHTHRLYVADGFAQELEPGLERLEVDLATWRHVMSHAKSLSLKMLATDAVSDDVAILSGLLARPDLEEMILNRLGKLARPLDQVEQSLRWPMQSELAVAGKIQDIFLKQDSAEPVPLYISLVSLMPLPKQKRFNLYADYYEASSKAASEGRFANLPKRAAFVRYPAKSWIDYGVNPIENIVGVPPLPEWETYSGRILELDARLRLAGLQAWIRRSPREQDIHTRMAKAGQALYDPFTGFPMLVNRRKGLMYSVGEDGKDHDGQAGLDIAAVIPSLPGGTFQDGKRSASAIKPR